MKKQITKNILEDKILDTHDGRHLPCTPNFSVSSDSLVAHVLLRLRFAHPHLRQKIHFLHVVLLLLYKQRCISFLMLCL